MTALIRWNSDGRFRWFVAGDLESRRRHVLVLHAGVSQEASGPLPGGVTRGRQSEVSSVSGPRRGADAALSRAHLAAEHEIARYR